MTVVYFVSHEHKSISKPRVYTSWQALHFDSSRSYHIMIIIITIHIYFIAGCSLWQLLWQWWWSCPSSESAEAGRRSLELEHLCSGRFTLAQTFCTFGKVSQTQYPLGWTKIFFWFRPQSAAHAFLWANRGLMIFQIYSIIMICKKWFKWKDEFNLIHPRKIELSWGLYSRATTFREGRQPIWKLKIDLKKNMPWKLYARSEGNGRMISI